MWQIFSPEDKFSSPDGAIRTDRADLVTTHEIASMRGATNKNDLSKLKKRLKQEKAKSEALGKRVYYLPVIQKPSFWDVFDWPFALKVLFVCISIIATTFYAAITAPRVSLGVVEKPETFKFYRPNSYSYVEDDDGNFVYTHLTADQITDSLILSYNRADGTYALTTADRLGDNEVINQLPTDAEDLKALAYMLYQTGNRTMVTVPYASYYEVGTNSSGLLGMTLPLSFSTVDIRDNTTGTHYRETKQFLTPGEEIDSFVELMSKAFASDAKHWYHVAGMEDTYYESTNVIEMDGENISYDWSKMNSNDDLPAGRQNIYLHPIPYYSASFRGKIGDQDKTAENRFNGTYWEYDEESGYSLPYYIDGAGQKLGYEKTDQHISYDPSHRTYKDIEDYFTTISSAEVTYFKDENGFGYYEVYLVLDSTKEYTHIDTVLALQDKKGADDPTARFTRFEVKFQLWDNGYFKQWEMWEDWIAPNARGLMEMSAVQYYKADFDYDVHAITSIQTLAEWAQKYMLTAVAY